MIKQYNYQIHRLQEKYVKEKQIQHWKAYITLQDNLRSILNKVFDPISNIIIWISKLSNN